MTESYDYRLAVTNDGEFWTARVYADQGMRTLLVEAKSRSKLRAMAHAFDDLSKLLLGSA